MTRAAPKLRAKRPRLLRSEFQPTLEQQEVLFSRVEAFIDPGRTLRVMLAEAYLQGMRDTLDCQEQRGMIDISRVRDVISV